MNELGKNWLPLMEYSVRSGISTSTVRRHIKAKKIEFKFHNGKYYIFDEPKNIEKVSKIEKPLNIVSDSYSQISVSSHELPKTLDLIQKTLTSLTEIAEVNFKEKDNVIHKLWKKIELLESEISDLKTLVSILESKK